MSDYFSTASFFKSDVIRELAAAEDQKAAVWKAIGDALDHITLTGNKFIMAVYISRETSRGGIIKPDQTLKEDIFQSKVGLILKAGPDAFRFKGAYHWVQPYEQEQIAIEYLRGLKTGAVRLGEPGYDEYLKAINVVHDYRHRSDKYTPKPNDWIQHFPSDTRLFGLRGVACRLAADSQAEFILTKPEDII
jgi:hypothetical protein